MVFAFARNKRLSLVSLANSTNGLHSARVVWAHTRVSPSTRVLAAVSAVGLVLLGIAIGLDVRDVDVPPQGVRWLYFWGSICTFGIVWNILVDLVYTWIELKFFLQLVQLPASKKLHKSFFNVVGAFITHRQLWVISTVNGRPPPEPVPEAPKWIGRVLLCLLLFLSTAVAIEAVGKALIAWWYTDSSRQKIITALQHEYVLYRLVREKLLEDSGAVPKSKSRLFRLTRARAMKRKAKQQQQQLQLLQQHAANSLVRTAPASAGLAVQSERDSPVPAQHSKRVDFVTVEETRSLSTRSWGLFRSRGSVQVAVSAGPPGGPSPGAPMHPKGAVQLPHASASAKTLKSPSEGPSADSWPLRQPRRRSLGDLASSSADGVGSIGGGVGGRLRGTSRLAVTATAEVGGAAPPPPLLSSRHGSSSGLAASSVRLEFVPEDAAAAPPPPPLLPLLPPLGGDAAHTTALLLAPGPLGSGTGRGYHPGQQEEQQEGQGQAGVGAEQGRGSDGQVGGGPGGLPPVASAPELRALQGTLRRTGGGQGAGLDGHTPRQQVGPHTDGSQQLNTQQQPSSLLTNRTSKQQRLIATSASPGGQDPNSGAGGTPGGVEAFVRQDGRPSYGNASDTGTDDDAFGYGSTDAERDSAPAASDYDVSFTEGAGPQSQVSSQSLNTLIHGIEQTDTIHIRRTLLASLELHDWLKEQHHVRTRAKRTSAIYCRFKALQRGSIHADKDEREMHPATARRELRSMRTSPLRSLISPRVLLDELLQVYVNLSDVDIPHQAEYYAEAVWKCVCPEGDAIVPEEFTHIFPKEEDRAIAWEAFDQDKDGRLTLSEVKGSVVSFLQQKRSMALTVRAVRSLTTSLQVCLIAIINGIFLMVVYLQILDVARLFSSGSSSKTALDFFSAYVVVVSLLFAEQIRNILSACVLILVQQPFDVGEEIVVEEAPGWRYMGIIQDFNLFYLRIKKSTDGELVVIPMAKLVGNKFTNLSRSDWKIEQNYFAVDLTTPPSILAELKEAVMEVINGSPGEYDTSYGFTAFFHTIERPNKLVVRTFHKYKFSFSAPHKRIAAARHGVINAIREVFNRNNIYFTELRLHAPLLHTPVGAEAAGPGAGPGADPVAAAAMAAGAVPWNGGGVAAPGAAMPAALEGPYGGGMGMPYGGGAYGMYGGGPVK